MQAKLSASTIKQLKPAEKAFEVVDTEIKGFLLRVQPTGRMTFYFSYRALSGKRKRIKLGVLGPGYTIAQARDDAAIQSGSVTKGLDVQNEKVSERQSAQAALKSTLGHFMEEQYKPWALANLKSGQQTLNYVTKDFGDYLDVPMSEIQLKKIERWRTEQLNNGKKPASINRVVNSLRAVLTKAVEWDFISEHPLARLKALRIDEGKKARYLSDLEEKALMAALQARDQELKAARARGNEHRQARGYPLLPDLLPLPYADRMTPLVTLSLKTGMRRGELFDLQWHAVDLANQVITVEGETAKSSKTRHIPLSPVALETLKLWRKQAPQSEGRVFPADDGGRLDNVNKSWRSILKTAGIQKFRWHDLRHDFASKLVMKGVPLNTIRELCGHADLNTTLRYAHLAPDHKASAIALIG